MRVYRGLLPAKELEKVESDFGDIKLDGLPNIRKEYNGKQNCSFQIHSFVDINKEYFYVKFKNDN